MAHKALDARTAGTQMGGIPKWVIPKSMEWDAGLYPSFKKGLEGLESDQELRLSVYGGQGQNNIGYSEWISKAALITSASTCGIDYSGMDQVLTMMPNHY